MIVGGSKADLAGTRKVPIEEAISVASRYGACGTGIEVSAKTGQNVDALFGGICLEMVKTIHPQVTSPYPRPLTQVANIL